MSKVKPVTTTATATKTTTKKVAPVKPIKPPKINRATIIGKLLLDGGGSAEEISKLATAQSKGKVRTDVRDVTFLGNILVKCDILTLDSKGIYKLSPNVTIK